MTPPTKSLDETAGKQPEHLQGEGTYTYDCKHHGCFYCEKMNINPPKPVVIVIHQKHPFFWNIYEIKFITKNWETMSYRQMSTELDRTPKAIRVKGKLLGLGVKTPVWTKKAMKTFRVPKSFKQQRTAQTWD